MLQRAFADGSKMPQPPPRPAPFKKKKIKQERKIKSAKLIAKNLRLSLGSFITSLLKPHGKVFSPVKGPLTPEGLYEENTR